MCVGERDGEDGAVAEEELAHISLTVVLVDVLGDVLASTLDRTLNEVVSEVGDRDVSGLDGLGASDEVDELDTDSPVV